MCMYSIVSLDCYTLTWFLYVTWHKKTRLMYTKYTFCIMLHISFTALKYQSSVNCIRLPMNLCINGENFIRLLFLSPKLFQCVHISTIFSFWVTYKCVAIPLKAQAHLKTVHIMKHTHV